MVYLPVAPFPPEAPDNAPALAPSRHDMADLAGIRVLVVDGDADARALMLLLFEGSRAHVIAVALVAEAMEAVHAKAVDVVLSDVGMPGEDGYSLIRQIRAMPTDKGGRMPVIALTAFARPEDRRRVMLAGFHLHLSKPVEIAELRAAVATLVGRSTEEEQEKETQGAGDIAAPSSAGAPSRPPTDDRVAL